MIWAFPLIAQREVRENVAYDRAEQCVERDAGEQEPLGAGAFAREDHDGACCEKGARDGGEWENKE
jgi:hypothetical protein